MAEQFRVEQRVAEVAMTTKWMRIWEEASVPGLCVDDAVFAASASPVCREANNLRPTPNCRAEPLTLHFRSPSHHCSFNASRPSLQDVISRRWQIQLATTAMNSNSIGLLSSDVSFANNSTMSGTNVNGILHPAKEQIPAYRSSDYTTPASQCA